MKNNTTINTTITQKKGNKKSDNAPTIIPYRKLFQKPNPKIRQNNRVIKNATIVFSCLSFTLQS